MVTSRWVRAAALLSAGALVLAGCADDDGNGAEPTPTAGGTSTAGGDFQPISLRVGSLLTQTGALSSIIDALEEPLRMLTEEINAQFPDLITIDFADGGTDPAIASTNVDQFLTGDHSAIMGAADTGSSTAIVDKVQDAGVVMCSGSNTGANMSAFEPYYIRTAPSDELQAPTLGDLIIDDGNENVAVVWRNDEYGVGFGEQLASYLGDSGVTVTLEQGYDPTATSFADLMDGVAASGADALAMITFAEGGQMLLDMQGRFDGAVYVADGFVDTVGEEQLGGQVELLEGIRGTYPTSAPETGEPTFPGRFADYSPGTPTVFSAHYYDCLMVVVLAAQKAQSSDPTVFVNELVGITNGPGTKCSLFADCYALLAAGEDIDYDGASGPLDFLPNGQPGSGTYDIFEFDAEGVQQVERQVLVAP